MSASSSGEANRAVVCAERGAGAAVQRELSRVRQQSPSAQRVAPLAQGRRLGVPLSAPHGTHEYHPSRYPLGWHACASALERPSASCLWAACARACVRRGGRVVGVDSATQLAPPKTRRTNESVGAGGPNTRRVERIQRLVVLGTHQCEPVPIPSEPSPGADVGGVSPVPVQMWEG